MKSPIINLDNKKAGEIDLDDTVFGLPVRLDILNSAVNWHLSKRHTGSHKTKERAEVKGSTAKPFNQKGTGRARQGDKKAPHLRGGGVAFGPRVRDNTISLPKKVRKLALKTALSEKLSDGKLVILDEAVSKDGRSSILAKQIKSLGWGSALIVVEESIDSNFRRAAQNIKGLNIMPQIGANTYDILRSEILVLTKEAVASLEARLK